jgi:hypothetical protein
VESCLVEPALQADRPILHKERQCEVWTLHILFTGGFASILARAIAPHIYIVARKVAQPFAQKRMQLPASENGHKIVARLF